MGKGQAFPICALPCRISITDLDNSPLHLHLSACSSGGAVDNAHLSCGVHWDMGQASPYSQTNAA